MSEDKADVTGASLPPENWPQPPTCRWDDYDSIREFSQAEEDRTGCDSVQTIEAKYPPHMKQSGWDCVWPRCSYHTANPVLMWKHVHFGKHREEYVDGEQ